MQFFFLHKCGNVFYVCGGLAKTKFIDQIYVLKLMVLHF
jgi:hypothetical protein